jgi:hypothetical protein
MAHVDLQAKPARTESSSLVMMSAMALADAIRAREVSITSSASTRW